jgi:hypothetical protein
MELAETRGDRSPSLAVNRISGGRYDDYDCELSELVEEMYRKIRKKQGEDDF